MIKFRTLLLFALVFTLPLFAEGPFDPDALYLGWKRNPESTMVIQWLSRKDQANDLILYQKEGDTQWQQMTGSHATVPEGHPYFIHRVELTNLEPNSKYAFRIGSEGVIYKFRTMPKTLTGPIKFVEGGDLLHDGIALVEQTNRQAAKNDPAFAVLGGDIAYAADTSSGIFPESIENWLDFLQSWKETMVTTDGCLIPIIPAIGNHETSGAFNQSPMQAPFFYALFAFPGKQGYNVIDFGDYMSIFVLDTDHTHRIQGKQTDWLDNVLEDRIKVPFKFAVYHVPAYPAVRKFNGEHCVAIRTNWVPLFERFGLTAAFEHHDHAYKRTYPLRKGNYHPNGVLYLGDGGWGIAKARKVKVTRKDKTFAKTASTNNFIVVTIDPKGSSYLVLDRKGKTIDTYEQEVNR